LLKDVARNPMGQKKKPPEPHSFSGWQGIGGFFIFELGVPIFDGDTSYSCNKYHVFASRGFRIPFCIEPVFFGPYLGT
jgi:hypothetical protein